MNENRLKIYKKSTDKAKQRTGNDSAVPPLNFSQLNSRQTPKNLRAKRRLTEIPPDYTSPNETKSKDLYFRAQEIANSNTTYGSLFQFDKSLHLDSDFNPLKFFIKYHYGTDLNATDSGLMNQPYTTMESMSTNRSLVGQGNKSRNEEQFAKTTRERLASPRATRLEPLNRAEAGNNKTETDKPGAIRQTYLKKSSIVRKMISVDDQSQSVENTSLNMSKPRVEYTLKSENSQGHSKKFFKTINKEELPQINNQSMGNVPINESLHSPRSVPMKSKSFLSKKMASNFAKKLQASQSMATDNPPSTSNASNKNQQTFDFSNCETAGSQNQLPESNKTGSTINFFTPCKTPQVTRNNSEGPELGKKDSTIPTKNDTAQQIPEKQPQLNGNLTQMDGKSTVESKGMSEVPTIANTNAVFTSSFNEEQKVGAIKAKTDAEKKTPASPKGVESPRRLTNLRIDIPGTEKLPKIYDDHLISRSKSTNNTPAPKNTSKFSLNTEISDKISTSRKQFASKRAPHSLKFNFNKKSVLARPDTDSDSETVSSSSTDSYLMQESPQARRYFDKEGASPSRRFGFEEHKTPIDEVWAKSFNTYTKIVEQKVDSLAQYNLKEIAMKTTLGKSVNERPEEEISSNSPKFEDLLALDLIKSPKNLGREPSFEAFLSSPRHLESSNGPKQKLYKINVIPPINEETCVHEHEHSLDKIAKEPDQEKEQKQSAESVDNQPEQQSPKKLNLMRFEFFTEALATLQDEKPVVSYSEWSEMERLENQVTDEEVYLLDMFDQAPDKKSYVRYKLEVTSELFYKIFAYLLRKPLVGIPLSLETKLELQDKAADFSQTTFIFTPKFERYSSHITQQPEDVSFIYELVGDLPERLISILPGYNENLLEAQNDETRFNEIDLLRFRDNEIVEPITAFTSVTNSSRKSALILTVIENESKIQLLMRNLQPVTFPETGIDIQSKRKQLLEKIMQINPKSMNHEYILQLIERFDQRKLLGFYESEIEVKETKIQKKGDDGHKSPRHSRRPAAVGVFQSKEQLAAPQMTSRRNARRRSKTLLITSPTLPPSQMGLKNRGSLIGENKIGRRLATKASYTKKDTEVIDEVEEEPTDKPPKLLAKESEPEKNLSKTQTTPSEVESLNKRKTNNNDNSSFDGNENKFEPYPNKRTNSGVSEISQIQKKTTESDNLNFAPTRMFTNSSTQSYERMQTITQNNVGANSEPAAIKITIPNMHLLAIDYGKTRSKTKNDKDPSPKSPVQDEASPFNRLIGRKSAMFQFQKRGTVVQIPEQEEDLKTNKTRITETSFQVAEGEQGKPHRSMMSAKNRRQTLVFSGLVSSGSGRKNSGTFNVTQMGTKMTSRRSVYFKSEQLSNNPNNPAQYADIKDETGDTMLIVAVKNGNIGIASQIISRNPDVNAQNNEGNTALHVALQYGHNELADMLIAEGAQQNIKNAQGKTPWEYARS